MARRVQQRDGLIRGVRSTRRESASRAPNWKPSQVTWARAPERSTRRISIRLSRVRTIGRSDSVCGEIGAMTTAPSERMNDRAAAGEGVGGGTGRSRDHEPVAAMHVDEAAVEPDLELDHAPGFLALDDDVIEARGSPASVRPRA